jgi:hypothetical protein
MLRPDEIEAGNGGWGVGYRPVYAVYLDPELSFLKKRFPLSKPQTFTSALKGLANLATTQFP